MKSQFSFYFANLLMINGNSGSYRKFGTAGLGANINEAIEYVRLRLNDYRRAKAPIQDQHRKPDDNRPVILKERPESFSHIIRAAQDYRIAFDRLKSLVSKIDK